MLAPNTVLQNRYLIVSLLGQGGMGAVYQATDQRLGNTVALKETFFTDEMMLKAFEREARLLASLRHAALPKVSDHFTEGKGQFLVMEYISGNDLMTMLERRGAPFECDQVVEWAEQLLGALSYLHSQQPPIIHRDIKPQNLKITDQGQIILLDFGLAKGLPEQTQQMAAGRSIYGYTPDYAPLEQIKAEGTEARSDLYALAATLYHLLTNVTPPSALMRAVAVTNHQPDLLLPANQINPQVRPGVANVLTQAMALMREGRPASAYAMRQLLLDANRAPAPTVAAPQNLPPTIMTRQPMPPNSAAPGGQPSSPNVPGPMQPGGPYSQPQGQPGWQNTQPSVPPGWQPPPQPSWPAAPPPQPSWPNAQPQPPQQASWPNAQPPQPGWQNVQPQPTQQVSWPDAQPPQPSWPAAQPNAQPSWPNAAPQWENSFAEPPRKSRTGLWIVLGLLLVLLLGGGAVLAIISLSEPSSSAPSQRTGPVSNPPEVKQYDPPKTASPTDPSASASDSNSNTSSDQTTAPVNMVDKLLERYVAAIGGEQAVRAITSRRASGSFEVSTAGVAGTTEIYQKAPNKNLVIVSVPGLMTFRTGFNGSVGWEQDAQGNLRRLSATEVAAAKRDNDFYSDLNMRSAYSSMNLSGKEKVDGHDALIVDARGADGSEDKLYFDMQSGLLLRKDSTRQTPQGATVIKNYLEDYRSIDGIKMPYTYRQENSQFTATIRIKEVRHNTPISDAEFNVPQK